MKPKFKHYYMKIAAETAKLSYARRLQVGAIVVKDDRIISIGYNGMPAGWDNKCEDKVFASTEGWMDPPELFTKFPYEETSDEDGAVIDRYRLVTKPEVLHAETNAVSKLAKSNESGDGASLFVTHMPCIDCAKLIYQSGISTVYYHNSYRTTDGIDFLKKSGVNVEQINTDNDIPILS